MNEKKNREKTGLKPLKIPDLTETQKRKLSRAVAGKESTPRDKKEINRIKTGIVGFDEMVGRGIPEGSLILLSGATGTGKSIFGMDFLIKGIEVGEPGCYISLEESVEDKIRQMNVFSWDLEGKIRKNELLLEKTELYDFDEFLMTVEDAIIKINAKRLVIDSLSLVSLYFQDSYNVRRAVFDLQKSIKNMDCTTIALSEVPSHKNRFSRFGVEEFVADGLIILYLIKKENVFHRGISVIKMRSTDHSLKVHPFQIEEGKGIVTYPAEELFTRF